MYACLLCEDVAVRLLSCSDDAFDPHAPTTTTMADRMSTDWDSSSRVFSFSVCAVFLCNRPGRYTTAYISGEDAVFRF